MADNMKFLRFVLVICLPAIVTCATMHRLGELPEYAAISPDESNLVELTRIKRSEGISGSGASATGIGNTVSSSSKNTDLLSGLLGGLLSGGGGSGGGGLLGGVTGGLLGGGGGGAGGLLGILLMLILKLLPSLLGVLG